ncbi:thioredoxin-disulfide reductase [Candidatus Bathyarchaeota archaeon]|nr:MAG: thioredoxin-disulfide reductase [Candidatus Bathyarchaeota archaeon]
MFVPRRPPLRLLPFSPYRESLKRLDRLLIKGVGFDGDKEWELVIVGGGAAGLTAGIYGARSGLRTLILEEKVPGGALTETPMIENYPGFPEGISGMELASKLVKQAERMGVEIHELEAVNRLDLNSAEKTVYTDKTAYTASAVILALGSTHKTLDVPGEEELRGRGVSYCAVCDGAFFRGKRVLVVGGGNSAAVSALYLSNLASEVWLVHRRDRLRAEEALVRNIRSRGVKILWNTVVKEIKGKHQVESVVLLDNKTGKPSELKVDGVFIQVGEKPNSEIARRAGVNVDEEGYIIVDNRQRTNIPGVYAAGDVTTCPVKQIGTAVGQAIIAATEAFGYIRRPYYYKG